MNKEIKNWLDMADYDLTTAYHMQKSGRALYVVFMCHLALEKVFKAIVCAATRKAPPKTHDLIRLMEVGNISLDQEQLDFIGIINNVSVVTRYPEDFSKLLSSYSKNVVLGYLDRTKEIIQCLKRDARLKK